jgi:hypothetical protein
MRPINQIPPDGASEIGATGFILSRHPVIHVLRRIQRELPGLAAPRRLAFRSPGAAAR